MKIRTDFVTNSSSSSFIIEQVGGVPATVESVYQTIKKSYVDLFNNFNKLMSDIDAGEVSGIDIEGKNGFISFDFGIDDFERLRDKYGMVIYYSLRMTDLEWVDLCNTYDEYEQFWIKKINKNAGQWWAYAPFTIRNMADSFAKFIHRGETKDSPTDESNEDVVSWYEWECGKTIALDCICVESECGYINEAVVNELGKVSAHWCNHMG